MAARKPVVIVSGELQQIQVGDTVDPVAIDNATIIDKQMTSGGPSPELVFDVDGTIMLHLPSS